MHITTRTINIMLINKIRSEAPNIANATTHNIQHTIYKNNASQENHEDTKNNKKIHNILLHYSS